MNDDITYFGSFDVEHIPEEIKKFIGNKNIQTNTFRIQAYNSVIRGYFCVGFINFMLNCKSLTDYNNLFWTNDFKTFMTISKMAGCNSIDVHHIYPNLNDQQHFILNKTNKIKYDFLAEIKERELMSRSKKLSKCIASFDYFDKSLIFLSAKSGSISIASFATVTGIASATVSLAFSIFTGIVKKSVKTTWNKKKRCNTFVMLARAKLNSIQVLISQALINNEISHGNFMAIINEERNY